MAGGTTVIMNHKDAIAARESLGEEYIGEWRQMTVRWCLGCGGEYECDCKRGEPCAHHTCDETDPEYPL
jgi:hypothetical protein